MRARHLALQKQYFQNKYKTYLFKDLQSFFYDFLLHHPTLPSANDMKDWNQDKKTNLQFIDEYLEQHRQEKYSFNQVLKITDFKSYFDFQMEKFREVMRHATHMHREKQEEHQKYHDDQRKQQEQITDEL